MKFLKYLPLSQIILLDRIQKKLAITDDATTMLKRERLIEGRKPKIFRLFVLTKVKNQ